MSKYRFTTDDTGLEVVFEMPRSEFARQVKDGKLKRRSKLDGKPIVFTFLREETPMTAAQIAAGVNAFPHPSTYPMWSDAMGINPDQIDAAREHDRANGLNVDYHPDTGAVYFPDRAARRRYCEYHGVYDLNGSYSDPQQKKFDPPEPE